MRIGLCNGSSRGEMGAGWTSNENNGFMFNVALGSVFVYRFGSQNGAQRVPIGGHFGHIVHVCWRPFWSTR